MLGYFKNDIKILIFSKFGRHIEVIHQRINSLWSFDAIWRYRSGSTSAEAMHGLLVSTPNVVRSLGIHLRALSQDMT